MLINNEENNFVTSKMSLGVSHSKALNGGNKFAMPLLKRRSSNDNDESMPINSKNKISLTSNDDSESHSGNYPSKAFLCSCSMSTNNGNRRISFIDGKHEEGITAEVSDNDDSPPPPDTENNNHRRRSFMGEIFANKVGQQPQSPRNTDDVLQTVISSTFSDETMDESNIYNNDKDEVPTMDSDFTFLSISERRDRRLSIHEDFDNKQEENKQNNNCNENRFSSRRASRRRQSIAENIIQDYEQEDGIRSPNFNNHNNNRRLSFRRGPRNKNGIKPKSKMSKSTSTPEFSATLSAYVSKQKKAFIDSLSEEAQTKKTKQQTKSRTIGHVEHEPRRSLLGRRLSNRCQHSINIQINVDHGRNSSIISKKSSVYSGHSMTAAERDAALVASMFEEGELSDEDDDFDDNEEINLGDYTNNNTHSNYSEQNGTMDDSNTFVEELVEKLKAEGSIQIEDNDNHYNDIRKCRGNVFHSVYNDSNASSINHNNSRSNSDRMMSASELGQDHDNTNEEKEDWNIKKIFRNKKEERELEVALSLCF